MVLGIRISIIIFILFSNNTFSQDVLFYNSNAIAKIRKGYDIHKDTSLCPIAYFRNFGKKNTLSILMCGFMDEYDIVLRESNLKNVFYVDDTDSGGWLSSMKIEGKMTLTILKPKIVLRYKSNGIIHNEEFINVKFLTIKN